MFEIFPLKIQPEFMDKFSEFEHKFKQISRKNGEILLKIVANNSEIYLYAIYESDKITIFTDAKISRQYFENQNTEIFVCKDAKICDILAFDFACKIIFENKLSK